MVRLATAFLGYLAVLSLLLFAIQPLRNVPAWLGLSLAVGGLWVLPSLAYYFVFRSFKTGHEPVFLVFWSAILGIISIFGFGLWIIFFS